jgi:MscS family membrane protein
MNTNTVNLAFGLNDIPWLQEEVWGNQLWQYLVFLLYVVAAVFLSKLADVLMARYFRALAQKTSSEWDDKLIELLRGPLKLTVFIILMHLGIRPMNKPDWVQDYLRHAFGILVAVVITYAMVKLVDFGFEMATGKVKRSNPRVEEQILVLLRKAVKIFVIATAILVTASNNGIQVGGALASLGVTGLAVALAAQETLSNFLGSIVILADRPFLLGDRVKIGADEGVVQHIGIRSTRLRTQQGDVITIPNRTVASSSVFNYSKTAEQLTQTAQKQG